MRVTVLGCGSSGGVPLIGPEWGACDPADRRNRRRRVSILVEHGGTRLLVDTAPDLREQFLDAGIADIDAVLYTHGHADHVHGIDELRSINYRKNGPIDVYGDADTLAAIRARFDYAFDRRPEERGWWRPYLVAHAIEAPFRIGAIDVVPFEQHHGRDRTLGYRFGKFAYSTDTNGFPTLSWQTLRNLDLWIVDCLRFAPHPSHAHVDLVLRWIGQLRPRRAVLTHMNIDLDYESLKAMLPAGVEPAYDGMVLDIDDQ